MRGSSFGYLIRVGIKSVFKNRLMSFAAIGVLVACLMLIGSAALISLNVNSVMGFLEDQNEVMLFIQDSVDEKGIENIDLDLHSMDNLMEIEFISRDAGLATYQERLGEDAELFNELEGAENPLPNSFIVRVDDLSRLQETLDKLRKLEGVERVNAPTDIASTVVAIKQAVYVAGIGIVAVLGIVALIIIANTIKITVFNRRKEINIMKFVGATDAFIKLPFIVEGMVIGLVAAAFAYLLVWGGYVYLLSWMEGAQSPLFALFREQVIPFDQIALLMAGGFTGAGIFIGVGGSMIFVRKYLRV